MNVKRCNGVLMYCGKKAVDRGRTKANGIKSMISKVYSSVETNISISVEVLVHLNLF